MKTFILLNYILPTEDLEDLNLIKINLRLLKNMILKK